MPFGQQRENCSHPNLSSRVHDSAGGQPNYSVADRFSRRPADSPENRLPDHWSAVCHVVPPHGSLWSVTTTTLRRPAPRGSRLEPAVVVIAQRRKRVTSLVLRSAARVPSPRSGMKTRIVQNEPNGRAAADQYATQSAPVDDQFGSAPPLDGPVFEASYAAMSW